MELGTLDRALQRADGVRTLDRAPQRAAVLGTLDRALWEGKSGIQSTLSLLTLQTWASFLHFRATAMAQ